MISIKDAKYIGNYKLEVVFDNNKKGIVDLENFIKNGKIKPFKKLEDLEKFRNFRIDYTIKWDDELDLAPEYLYFEAFKNDKSLQNKFKQWGYI